MRNPYASIPKQLGLSQADYDAAKAAVVAAFKAHDDKADVDEAIITAAHAALAEKRVLNQVLTDLGV